jgi:hypothetical protein
MVIPSIWVTGTTHVIVSNPPDLISFWREKSASADQAIATAGADQQPPFTHHVWRYPNPALHRSRPDYANSAITSVRWRS